MKLTIIGAGYVGLVSGTCLAEQGHRVTCVDVDAKKIAQLKKGRSPVYEQGLEELIRRNIAAKRLFFTADLSESAPSSKVISIAVGTPSAPDGSVDLSYIKQAAQDIAKTLANVPKSKRLPCYVIATKSTVPLGTGQLITEIIKKHYDGRLSVASNPEFLREGQAVYEFLHPDRIVIGVEDDWAKQTLTELYHFFPGPILVTNRVTAEMIKYAANTYLATSISFINSLSQLCESVGADVTQVAQALRLDRRIGPRAFLTAGPGWGGSCFPKDVKGLIHFAHQIGLNLPIIEATLTINDQQKQFVIDKIVATLKNLKGKKLAVWGLSFKANTDDVRDSPAIEIIKLLLEKGAVIHAHDPVAERNATLILPSIRYALTPYETAPGAEAIVVLTDWPPFKEVNWRKIKSLMAGHTIFDFRNLFDRQSIESHGLHYLGLGR